MLTDTEDVEPYLVGELDLFEEVAEPLRRSDGLVREFREGVDAELDRPTVTTPSRASMQRKLNACSSSSSASADTHSPSTAKR
jgi:hypothetical protein